MTEDEVDDYVAYLRLFLPPAHAHLTTRQVRSILDAEAVYFERRFGPIHGWRALLRSVIGRGEPEPRTVEAALPEFERYVVEALAGRTDLALTREDIGAVMRIEGEVGPRWTPPRPPAQGQASGGHEGREEGDR